MLNLWLQSQKGFFTQSGLNVNIHSPSATTDAIKLVASGQDQFGVAFAGDVIEARSQGVPVVSVAVIHRHNPLGLLLNPSASIKTPKDLEGKQIGLTPTPNNRAMFWDFVTRTGIDKSKLHIVPIQFNGPELVAAGRLDACDAVTFYEPEAYKQITGVTPPFMSYTKYGVPDNYFFTIVTSDEVAKNSPDIIKPFLTGCLQGEKWSLQNPQAAEEILVKAANGVGLPFAEAARTAITPLLTDADTATKGLGWQSPQTWQMMVSWFTQQKLIPAGLDPTSVYTNAFLPTPPILA